MNPAATAEPQVGDMAECPRVEQGVLVKDFFQFSRIHVARWVGACVSMACRSDSKRHVAEFSVLLPEVPGSVVEIRD
jgi:hypothetical protein